MVPRTRTAKACIATVLAVLCVGIAIPTATATPEVNDDGSVEEGECVFLDPWSFPPQWSIAPMECV